MALYSPWIGRYIRDVRRRRLALALAIALVGASLGIALAPGLIGRPYAVSRLHAALGTPVRIGWISWNPFTAMWTVSGVRVAAERGPAAVLVRQARARLHLTDVLLGRYRVRLLQLRGARVRLRATPSGWALPLPPAPEPSGDAGILPAVRVDWLEAPHATVQLEPRPAVRSVMRARRLQANASVEPTGMRATVWTRGRLDRGSVTLVGQLRSGGDDRRVRVRLSAAGLDLARTMRLAPDTPVADLRGSLDVRAKYDESGTGRTLQRRASGRLTARDFALRAHGVDGVWIRNLQLSHFDADLEARRIALAAVDLGRPELWVRRSGVQFTIPGLLEMAVEGAPEDEGWGFSLRRAEVRDGVLHHIDAESGKQVLDVAVAHATTGAWTTPAEPVFFTVAASLGTGGTLSAQGQLARSPIAGTVALEIADVDLPPLVALTPSPVGLESGRVSGRLEIGLADGVTTRSGTITVRDVKTRPPDPARPEDVAAFKELRATLREARTNPPLVALDRLEIDWPYLLVDRSPEGIFPFSLIAGMTAAESATSPLQVRIERLETMGGRLDFRDATLEPPYWRALASLRLVAERATGPPLRIVQVRASALVDEVSPLRVEGTIRTETHLVAEVERLALPPFNAYLAGAAPYMVATGAVSGRSEIHLARSELEVNNRVVLSRLGLAGGGDDFVRREVGIPLTLALALMKDYRGNIELSLPFGGNLREPTFSMREVVLQAIVRAIRGAILSPLNALGRVFVRDGKIERFDLDPIPFPPGSATLDATGRARMDQVNRVLQTRPDLGVRVGGQAAAADVEQLRDEAALRSIVQTGGSKRLREFLEARITGGPARPLEAEDEARLADLLHTIPWPADQLMQLAEQRGVATAAALIVDLGLQAERVRAVDAEPPAPDRLAAEPSASVELVERARLADRLRPAARKE